MHRMNAKDFSEKMKKTLTYFQVVSMFRPSVSRSGYSLTAHLKNALHECKRFFRKNEKRLTFSSGLNKLLVYCLARSMSFILGLHL
jgi:hypothetical protein